MASDLDLEALEPLPTQRAAREGAVRDGCPKCGAPPWKIMGPHYVKGSTGEWLEYQCDTCGYKDKRRPLDSIPSPPPSTKEPAP
jgi:hypothetical protein